MPCTKSWEARECDQQFSDIYTTDIAKGQRLRQESNARINKLLAMRPGLAKIIEKLCISGNFECAQTDLHIAANARCNDHTETGSSKRVRWLSNSQRTNRSVADYGYETSPEFHIGDAWASLSITRINPRVARESKIQPLQASIRNTQWMDHGQVCDGCFKDIPILYLMDVKMANGYAASH